MKTRLLVRYGELSTKGKNKKSFTQQLAKNIRQALSSYPNIKIHPEYDFMFIDLNGEPEDDVIDVLRFVFGIQSISPVHILKKNMDIVKDTVIRFLGGMDLERKTFKIMTKRSDHQFEMDTNQINLFLGDAVLDIYPNLIVDVKRPNITIRVDVRHTHIMISLKTIPGAGGLPVGTSGRIMLMLSGGIDSPVAAYLSLKRGMEVQFVHFSTPPYTSEQSLEKTKQLARKLAKFGGTLAFYTVPFTEIQEEIKKRVPAGYLMTIMRRMMLRITDAIREEHHGLAIANGESVGQVASQTLYSMMAINDVTNTPIIRPVATMDKLDIIEIAQKIDTFELSIQPFEDCCTVFAPPSPKTRPKIEKAREYESRLDIEQLIKRCLGNVKCEMISYQEDINDMDDLF